MQGVVVLDVAGKGKLVEGTKEILEAAEKPWKPSSSSLTALGFSPHRGACVRPKIACIPIVYTTDPVTFYVT